MSTDPRTFTAIDAQALRRDAARYRALAKRLTHPSARPTDPGDGSRVAKIAARYRMAAISLQEAADIADEDRIEIDGEA